MINALANRLLIPYIGELLSPDFQNLELVIKQMGVRVVIDQTNWADYPYRPLVRLFSGYSKGHLWLHYEVEKDFFRVKALSDQEPVWEDSCVEFFISTGQLRDNEYLSTEDVIYRNFEFNALGICFSAVGNVEDRELLPSGEMKRILRFPGLDKENMPEEGAEFDWKLSVAFPLDLLGLEPGSTFRANCYKCGDLTRRPHFLSLFPIHSEAPDFHRPQFFGEMELFV